MNISINLSTCLKKEREQSELKESYLWLDSSDERKYMMDRENLDKYIDLDSSCLTKEEKKRSNGNVVHV